MASDDSSSIPCTMASDYRNCFAYVSRRFPKLLHHINQYGEPIAYWPVPTWRCWQVEEWCFYARRKGHEMKWHHTDTYWIKSFMELALLHERMPSTGGLHKFQRLYLSSWVWDYRHPTWQEQDYF
jgi:hypothetical protein